MAAQYGSKGCDMTPTTLTQPGSRRRTAVMMKWMLKWAFRLLILAIVLAVAGLLLKDVVLKSLLESRMRNATGLGVQIGKFESGLFTPTVSIEDLKLFYPPELGGILFASFPELHLEYDRTALSAGKLHLVLLRINLAEINLMTQPDGRNLPPVLKPKLGQATPEMLLGVKLDFEQIDVLNLSVRKIRTLHPGRPAPVAEEDLDLKNAVFHDLKSVQDFSWALLKQMAQNEGSLNRAQKLQAILARLF